jgi:hypothetical protein
LIDVGEQGRLGARLTVFGEDGRTNLGTSVPIDLEPGRTYEISVE